MMTHEEMCRRIVMAAPDGIWVVDPQGRTLFNNKRMAEILGADTASLSEQSCFECVFPDDLAEAQRQFAQGMAGTRQPFDFRLRRNDGSAIWVSISCGPLFDASGVVAGLLGLFSEITGRKLADAKIRESEERFRSMANCAPVLIWMSGSDKLCDFFNETWLTFTGRTMREELGNGWAEGVHPDDHAHCLEVYNSAFDARRPFEMEYRLRRHDGIYRWILHIGVPRRTPEGDLLGYVGSAVDITDRKHREESSHELAHFQRLAIMGELIAVIAHEIRQPLSAILCNVDAIGDLVNSEEPPLTDIHEILSDIRRDNRRANDFLSRIRRFLARRELQIELLDINAVISESLRFVANESVRRRVWIQTEFAVGLAPVRGDRTELQQVLLNLIVNGMEAMENTPQSDRRILLRTTRSGNYIQVSVCDNGCGMTAEALPRIFESFFTTRKDGTGLGLSIAGSIVAALRGRIWAENNPGGGATFHVAIPVAELRDEIESTSAARDRATVIQLHIDDNRSASD
jgi:PAS domain S-box-containing protein